MVNLTNLMMVWKTRNGEPTKGGYQQMINRLDKLKQVPNWTNDRAHDLLDFCSDFQIRHPLLHDIEMELSETIVDPIKCITVFNSINKY